MLGLFTAHLKGFVFGVDRTHDSFHKRDVVALGEFSESVKFGLAGAKGAVKLADQFLASFAIDKRDFYRR